MKYNLKEIEVGQTTDISSRKGVLLNNQLIEVVDASNSIRASVSQYSKRTGKKFTVKKDGDKLLITRIV